MEKNVTYGTEKNGVPNPGSHPFSSIVWTLDTLAINCAHLTVANSHVSMCSAIDEKGLFLIMEASKGPCYHPLAD